MRLKMKAGFPHHSDSENVPHGDRDALAYGPPLYCEWGFAGQNNFSSRRGHGHGLSLSLSLSALANIQKSQYDRVKKVREGKIKKG